MSSDNTGRCHNECCEVPVCLVITGVEITNHAKNQFRAIFETMCSDENSDNDNKHEDNK